MSAAADYNAAVSGSSSSQEGMSRRVLIVEGTTHTDRLSDLAEGLGLSWEVAPSYLSALGALSSDTAGILIGPGDVWRGSLDTVVNSAKTLSPGIQLVAVCESDDTDHQQAAVQAGFDHLLTPPFRVEALTAMLHGQPIEPVQEDTQADDEAPGDIDLIDALLSGKGHMTDVAARMIASHTGLQGLGIRPNDGEAPEGHACVEVTYQGTPVAKLFAAPPATEEHLHPWADWLGRWLALRDQFTGLQAMALRDELTGVWNRRYFNRFLDRILKRAQDDRSQVTLLVFDIDDFKLYNDHHGHGTGDMVLRETARLMGSVVREHDVVARIGGDEFAVIFWDNEKPRKPHSEHPHDVVEMARRFQNEICSHRFPKLLDQTIGRLTVSGGLASFPWDGRTAEDLLERADAMALQSKRQGKNAITFGTGPKRAST